MRHKIHTALKIRHSVPKNHQVESKIAWSSIMRQNSKIDWINRITFSSPFISSMVIFHRKRTNQLKTNNYFKPEGKHPKQQITPTNLKNPGFQPHTAPQSPGSLFELAGARASAQRDALDLDCAFGLWKKSSAFIRCLKSKSARKTWAYQVLHGGYAVALLPRNGCRKVIRSHSGCKFRLLFSPCCPFKLDPHHEILQKKRFGS